MGHVKGLFGDSPFRQSHGAGASGRGHLGFPRLLSSTARRRPVSKVAAALLCGIVLSLFAAVSAASAADPVVTIDPVANIGYTSAEVSGVIEPQEREGPYEFQISRDPVSSGWEVGVSGYVFAGETTFNVAGELTGLVAGAEYSVRLRFWADFSESFYSEVITFTTEAVAPPAISIDEPTAITPTSAHFSGEINPEGTDPASDVAWHFKCTPECPGLDGGTIPADLSSHQVSADATGLEPNTSYQVTLVATNAGEEVEAGPEIFQTATLAPAVTTGTATDLGTERAALYGLTNPFGLQTTYYFEYGTSTGYGSRMPTSQDFVAGSGRRPVAARVLVTGLQAGVEYHYRLTAVSAAGISHGADRTFTTLTPGAPSRAYEMVSPLDKGGSNIDIEGISAFQGTPQGDSLIYQAKTALSGGLESEAAPLVPKYSATRTATDWMSSPALDPPQIPGANSPKIFTTLGVSEDGTKAVVISLKALAPGAVDGDSNVYLRDIASGAYTTIATSPGPGYNKSAQYSPAGFLAFCGGTPDFSHVLLAGGEYSLIPGVNPGGIYEWSDGELRLASVPPGGGEFAIGSTVGGVGTHEPHFVSDDGSKVYFFNEGTVYLRRNGTTTEVVGPGEIIATTPSGRFLFYSDGAIHRFDAESGTSDLVATAVDQGPDAQASEDGQYLYFRSSYVLAEGAGAPGTATNVYVWHAGELSFITSLTRESILTEYMVSPSGRYFGFSSYSNLTGYDPSSQACKDTIVGDPGGACRQAYRYDAASGELTCASCRPDGLESTGNAHMSISTAEFSGHFPRTMLDTGELIFDTPDPLVAADTNSKRDVYSFDGERPVLISSGRGDGNSLIADASADGKNIFFTTPDQLVGRDTDTLVDVYDARIGGGLAAQNLPPARVECIRDDCKATPGAGPELPFGGSEALQGPGNVKPVKKKCRKGHHRTKVGGRSRCVKNHAKKKANNSRRSGR
jgi:hypothetical protein